MRKLDTQVRTPLEIFAMPQFLDVPVFQRRYVWEADSQWEPLWRDISRIAQLRLEGKTAQHFLGAIVTQSAPAGLGALPTHQLIDGQQRLTTLQLVIDAAAAEFATAGLEPLSQQLNNLTHNLAAYGDDAAERLKLRHQNDDRAVFVDVMGAEPPIEYAGLTSGRIRDAHEYFAEQVRGFLGDPVEPARAHALLTALSQGLQLVVISLGEAEPSQEIFETLNARGTPLTAADLVKNFVFQQVSAQGDDQGSAYREHWSSFEKPFWEKEISIGRYRMQRLSLFLNHWLVAQTGEEVSTRSTFTRFKSWFEEVPGRRMREVLTQLHQQGLLYEHWANEGRRSSGDLAPVPLFVYRTESAEIEAVKPLLLWLHDVQRTLAADVQERALRDIESWVMRRALLRREGSDYSRVVAALISDLRSVGDEDAATVLRSSLMRLNRPATYWPGDPEMRRELSGASIYTQPKRRVRCYLEAVEDAFRGYASGQPRAESRVSRAVLTIEHLLPQKWKPNWPVADLAAEVARDEHVHRLGNLTLLTQSLNSAVSNGPWAGAAGKRACLKQSDTLLMTREPREQELWDEGEIDARTATFIEALLATWQAPEGHNPEPVKRIEQMQSLSANLRSLVAAGLLAPGTILTGVDGQGTKHQAVITPEGALELGGVIYEYPSGAGKAASGTSVNGWYFWRLPDGSRLISLREGHQPVIHESASGRLVELMR